MCLGLYIAISIIGFLTNLIKRLVTHRAFDLGGISVNSVQYYAPNQNSRMLMDQTIRTMHFRMRWDIPYGLGFAVYSTQGIKLVIHSGINPGWLSCFILNPKIQTGIVVFMNYSNRLQLMRNIVSIWLKEILHMDPEPDLLRKILG